MPVRGGTLDRLIAVEVVPIGDEPLQVTDPDRLALYPANAFRFALRFLRQTRPQTAGREEVRLMIW